MSECVFKMTSKHSSTLHQINELLQPIPELGSDSDVDSDTQAKLVDKYDDDVEVEPRRSNLSVIYSFNDNPRYTGEKVSRKTVGIAQRFSDVSKADEKVKVSRTYNDRERSSDSSCDSDASIDGRVSTPQNDHVQTEEVSSGSEEEEEEEEDNDEEDGCDEEEEDNDEDGCDEDKEDEEEDDGIDLSTLGRNGKESPSNFQHLSNSTNLHSEIEKANAVRNQLSLWDKFVECRINLQKCLSLANRFPQHSTIDKFKVQGGESFSLEMKKTEKGVTNLLDKLLEMQEILISSYSETTDLGHSSSVNCEDEEVESDECENPCATKESTNLVRLSRKRKHVEDYENELSSLHTQYVEFRNATIQKWNDRTRVSFGKAKRSDFSSFEQTTLQQIQFVLSNRSRLIQRTRHRSAINSILGESTEGASEKEFDSEIFDDSDFYHQILKELIERHSDGTHDATALGRRWAEIQKLRTKMKRKIDTRATKGRKLRYTPHQKLVGLMAPVNLPSNWDDRATTELFNSLFGKKL